MTPNITVSVIIISYNTWHYLEPCIESIHNSFKGISYEIIVVDNASNDGSPSLIKQHFPEVILIKNNTNTGFAKANNQAAKIARGEYFFLLNADTVIKNNCIDSALEYMNKNNIAILGPKLVNSDGSLQQSYSKKNNIPHYIASIFSMALHLGKLLKQDKETYNSPMTMGFLVGAALLIKSDFVKRLGLFDEKFFFTGEERDLCLRYKMEGARIVYYPKWTILHYGGSGNPHSIFHIVNWFKASLQLVKKHGGLLSMFLVKIALAFFLLSYLTVFTLKSLANPQNMTSRANTLNYFKITKWFFGLSKDHQPYN